MIESMQSVGKCVTSIIDIKTIVDPRGNLSIIEAMRDIPFEIKRIYYIWDNINDSPRGGHAHKNLYQAFIAVHGSCTISIDNGLGTNPETVILKSPMTSLYLPPGLWRDLDNFSCDCVMLVLASDYYDENDYIRDYDEFLQYVRKT